jgi:hypothetical protein
MKNGEKNYNRVTMTMTRGEIVSREQRAEDNNYDNDYNQRGDSKQRTACSK